MLGDVLDFEQDPRGIGTDRHLRDRAVEDSIDAARPRPREFALHDALAARARTIEQGQQRFGAARQFVDRPAERLIRTQCDQSLGGRVQIIDTQIQIEYEHTGDEGIEQIGADDVQGADLQFSGHATNPGGRPPAALFVLRRQERGLLHVERDTRGLDGLPGVRVHQCCR